MGQNYVMTDISVSKRRHVLYFMESLSGVPLYPWMVQSNTFSACPLCTMSRYISQTVLTALILIVLGPQIEIIERAWSVQCKAGSWGPNQSLDQSI